MTFVPICTNNFKLVPYLYLHACQLQYNVIILNSAHLLSMTARMDGGGSVEQFALWVAVRCEVALIQAVQI